MRLRARDLFQTVHTEGGLLPGDLLQRVAGSDAGLDGLRPGDYHLAPGERLGEAISRSWSRLTDAWAGFDEARHHLPAGEPGGGLTRERWLQVLFHELGYGRLVQQPAIEIEGKPYPVYAQWQHTPIHLVGCGVPIDTRTAGVKGAAGQSPHSLLQELLNRSTGRLWGIVSNGLILRVLRDSVALTRQAYLEFDLEALFTGEVYADFVLLWLVCHQSRVEADRPEDCWLERWTRAAGQDGTRALDALRQGVQEAIETLGGGFLAHPANHALHHALRDGNLDARDYYRTLLRLVYRLLFLFVAEDRDALLDPAGDPLARERYLTHYSTRQIRTLATRRRGGRQHDRYEQLKLVMDALDTAGCPPLALPALGSYLWSREAIGPLADASLANDDLLAAIRSLATVEVGDIRRAVDFRNLGAEELGSVYESLLELHATLDRTTATFTLDTAAGSERKTTGSYYTPTSLISSLLDTALEPVLDEAAAGEDPEAAILSLTVVDPACGSGHFLIAAANRIAKRLAAIRSEDPEPSPAELRVALRDVVGRCLHGVDVNPMAVELCKVSLWMEALEPGRPLSFLDHRIVLGNSLLGTTPELIAAGIPAEMSILRQAYCSPKYLYYLLPGQEKAVREPNGSLRKEVLVPGIDEFRSDWERAVEALAGAIGLLRHPQEFGAISSQYLPYVSILPVFSALQHEVGSLPPHTRLDAQRKVRHWYWASVFTNRYSGSVESTAARDYLDVKGWLADDAAEPALLAEFETRFRSLELRKETKRGTSVYNGIFNLLVLRGARDWMTGNLPQHGDLDDHHIVPRDWGKGHAEVGSLIDTILNRTPMTADTNRHVINDRLPNAYLPALVASSGESAVRGTLESHFISPAAFDLLLRDPFTPGDFEAFLAERQRTIQAAIEDLLIKERLDLDPQLRDLDQQVEQVELGLRVMIAAGLANDVTRVPSNVLQKASERVQLKARKNPAFNPDSHLILPGMLEFFDLRELQDTITNKLLWPEFEERFRSKETLAAKFGQLAELRNALRHTRTVDEITRKEGEAALIWFEQLGVV